MGTSFMHIYLHIKAKMSCNVIAEVKSVGIFKNSAASTLYLTLKKVDTGKVIGGKISLEAIPEFLINNQFINFTINESPIGKQNYNQKIGVNWRSTSIDRFQITRAATFDGKLSIADIHYEALQGGDCKV